MLSNMRDSRGFYISKLYDLTKFYDQDFQEIQEIQDTVESKIFSQISVQKGYLSTS